jgi:hypothetical protein
MQNALGVYRFTREMSGCHTKGQLDQVVARWCHLKHHCDSPPGWTIVDACAKWPSLIRSLDLYHACDNGYMLFDALMQQYAQQATCAACYDDEATTTLNQAQTLKAPQQLWHAWTGVHRPLINRALDTHLISDLATIVCDYVCGDSPVSPCMRFIPPLIHEIPIDVDAWRHVLMNPDTWGQVLVQYRSNHVDIEVVPVFGGHRVAVRAQTHNKSQRFKSRWQHGFVNIDRSGAWTSEQFIDIPHPLPKDLVLQIITWDVPTVVAATQGETMRAEFIGMFLCTLCVLCATSDWSIALGLAAMMIVCNAVRA